MIISVWALYNLVHLNAKSHVSVSYKDCLGSVFGHLSAEEANTLLGEVGKALPVTHDKVTENLTRFTIHFVYNDKVRYTLRNARAFKCKNSHC